jgi:UDP-N-acetyl-D-glucosamine dehydrogenase
MFNELLFKIKKRKATVFVIGLGYVGLPLLNLISSKNYLTSGLDLNKSKILDLKKKFKKIKFYNNYNLIDFNLFDIIIIALPTPIKKNKDPDLSYVDNCIKKLVKKIKTSKLIVLESTTYPSTTNNYIVKPFSKKFEIGKNFFVGYSPEREDPGNKKFSIKNINKITSGFSKKCSQLTFSFYKEVCNSVIRSSSIEIAETTKIFENIFRSVNIGLVNEMKQICKKINIDINEVVNLAKTKPFGFMPFYPGPGVGGHCIPVDPFYLSWLAKKKMVNTKFIYLAGKINSDMPKIISQEINNYLKKNKINNPKILLLGVAYKKNIDDQRNSPSINIFKNLILFQIKVDYNDKFIKKIKINHKNFNSIKLNKKNISNYDAILLATNHDYYNKELIYSNAKLIFDTRNFFEDYKNKVIKL